MSSSTEATRTDEGNDRATGPTKRQRPTKREPPTAVPPTTCKTEVPAARQSGWAASESEQRQDTTARRAETGADDQADTAAEQQATLIPADRAESYNSRWNELKGEFVDEPRGAVRGANELVGEVLDELEELFRRQRADLEEGPRQRPDHHRGSAAGPRTLSVLLRSVLLSFYNAVSCSRGRANIAVALAAAVV